MQRRDAMTILTALMGVGIGFVGVVLSVGFFGAICCCSALLAPPPQPNLGCYSCGQRWYRDVSGYSKQQQIMVTVRCPTCGSHWEIMVALQAGRSR